MIFQQFFRRFDYAPPTQWPFPRSVGREVFGIDGYSRVGEGCNKDGICDWFSIEEVKSVVIVGDEGTKLNMKAYNRRSNINEIKLDVNKLENINVCIKSSTDPVGLILCSELKEPPNHPPKGLLATK